jgi:arginyl-tRNA synthetase
MLLDELRNWLNQALGSWAKSHGWSRLPAYTLEEPPAGVDADVACNLPLLLAKAAKKSPRNLAQEIHHVLEAAPTELVDGLSVAGAGFLNFRWSLKSLCRELQRILREKEAYGRSVPISSRKVLLEFVSANPTGPLHVGHGRGAALGDSLAHVLAHLGYDVQREYYNNDAGNQVQMLAESVRARCLELAGKHLVLPDQGYHGDYVKDIAREYLQTHPEGAEDLAMIQSFSLRRVQKEIENDLAGFGVHFDSWFSEASLIQKGAVDKCVELLKDKGFVQEYEDAVWFAMPGEKEEHRDKDRVLRRRDGRWTYFATDIAYHADKFERGFDRLIDVWGADHHGYVPRVRGSMQALGYDPERLHVVLYQLVSLWRGGVPVSMSKRSGDFITLREVLDEVGKDACRFFFALRGPNTALEFDLELAKKQSSENPVYYLQYAHARICSIFREAQKVHTPSLLGGEGWGEGIDLSVLRETEERELMKRLSLFPQTLRICAQEDSPHPLANYLLTLCRQFHHFYDHHRVLGVDPRLSQARLALVAGVRQVLALGLRLLGVSAPEKM